MIIVRRRRLAGAGSCLAPAQSLPSSLLGVMVSTGRPDARLRVSRAPPSQAQSSQATVTVAAVAVTARARRRVVPRSRSGPTSPEERSSESRQGQPHGCAASNPRGAPTGARVPAKARHLVGTRRCRRGAGGSTESGPGPATPPPRLSARTFRADCEDAAKVYKQEKESPCVQGPRK
jgi:hypothetical protein